MYFFSRYDIKDLILHFMQVFVTFIVFICIIIGVLYFTGKFKDISTKNYDRGYLDACKDFYKGKLKYELIENSDGTKEWKKVE